MNKRNTYYLVSIEDIDSLDYIDFDEDTFTKKEINELGLSFHCEIPDENTQITSDDIGSPEILKYKKLTDLILDFISDIDYDSDGILDGLERGIEYPDEILQNKVDEINDDYTDRYLLLIGEEGLEPDFRVLRFNPKTKLFSFVKIEDIENCVDRLHQNVAPQFDDINFDTFDVEFESFINDIENIIENGEAVITLTSKSGHVHISFFKKNTPIFKQLIKLNHDFDKIPSSNGYYYECSLESLNDFIRLELVKFGSLGCTIRTALKKQKGNTKQLYKVYGVGIGVIADKTIRFERINSKTLLECYTIDSKTKKPIPPDADTIYCGFEAGDVICGFDLL